MLRWRSVSVTGMQHTGHCFFAAVFLGDGVGARLTDEWPAVVALDAHRLPGVAEPAVVLVDRDDVALVQADHRHATAAPGSIAASIISANSARCPYRFFSVAMSRCIVRRRTCLVTGSASTSSVGA